MKYNLLESGHCGHRVSFSATIYIYLESLFHALSNYPQNFLTQASGENELCSFVEKKSQK
jgi:hypothetical protein